jgi:hypothetical protein
MRDIQPRVWGAALLIGAWPGMALAQASNADPHTLVYGK